MKDIDIHPTGRRVLVELDSPEKLTSGGIVVPDVAQHTSRRAVVIEAGPEVADKRLKKGARVVIAKGSGTDLSEFAPRIVRLVMDETVWALVEDLPF